MKTNFTVAVSKIIRFEGWDSPARDEANGGILPEDDQLIFLDGGGGSTT